MTISNCCGAGVYENTDICMECGEHCEVIDEDLKICGIDFNESIKQLDGLIKQARELKEKYSAS